MTTPNQPESQAFARAYVAAVRAKPGYLPADWSDAQIAEVAQREFDSAQRSGIRPCLPGGDQWGAEPLPQPAPVVPVTRNDQKPVSPPPASPPPAKSPRGWGNPAPIPTPQEVRAPSRQVQRRTMRTVSPCPEIGEIRIGVIENWEQNLIRAGNGDPQAIQVNIAYALAAAPELSGKLWYNQFAHTIDVYGALPWNPNKGPRAWDDTDHFCLISWCQGNPMINANTAITKGAVHQIAHMQDYDPLLRMIDAQVWDQKPRLDDWTVRLLGADDNPYVRAVGRKFVVAMVRRARRPGCKADNVLILGGPEGIGKSTILRALADPFFSDEIADLGSKDAAMQVRGVWLIEMSDLETLTRVEGVKANAFFSRSADRFRPPYGMVVIEQQRRSLVCGTTNEDEVLQHATGLRRYWIVECRKADVAGMKAERLQLIAEAAHYETQNEAHWLEGDLVEAQRVEAQRHRVSDSWREVVAEWIDGKTDHLRDNGFTARDVLQYALEIDTSKWNRALEMRAVRVLKDLGFTFKQHTEAGNRWLTPDAAKRLGIQW